MTADPKRHNCANCGRTTYETVGQIVEGMWWCFNCAEARRKASPTSAPSCIHRAGCPKPDVCAEVGHCTSMRREDIDAEKVLTSKEIVAYLVVTRKNGCRTEMATLPGYVLEPGAELLSEIPLVRAQDETTAVEYVQDFNLHEHKEGCKEAGCIAVIRAVKTSRKPGYMGDINGPGCDPDVP
jgi:hypothetical protein